MFVEKVLFNARSLLNKVRVIMQPQSGYWLKAINLLDREFTTHNQTEPGLFDDLVIAFQSYVQEFDFNKASERCKQESESQTHPYLLVSGDLSGIQDTVYTISSAGALKSLRGRSFLLQLLCEHICYELLQATTGTYRDSRGHIIHCGGGGFALLLPNCKTDEIDKFLMNVNQWLFRKFSGKLFLSVESLPLSETELNDNQEEKWQEVIRCRDALKTRKFKDQLPAIFGSPVEPVQKSHDRECVICHRDDVAEMKSFGNEGAVACPLCHALHSIGENLTRCQFIKRTDTSSSGTTIALPSFSGEDTFYELLAEDQKKEALWQLNHAVDKKYVPFLLGNYATKIEDLPEKIKKAALEGDGDQQSKRKNMASLQHLAWSAEGADLIACLRMDVDDLGKLFAQGLSVFTLTNFSNLSRLLNLFFTVILNDICAKAKTLSGFSYTHVDGRRRAADEKRLVSVVYSGGDDLLLLGAWDDVCELAYDIQQAFDKFIGLRISAAVTLHKADFPLYQIAHQSEKGLEVAKRDGNGEKHRMALFYNDNLLIRRFKIQERMKRVKDDYNREDSFIEDRLGACVKWQTLPDLLKFVQQFNQARKLMPHSLFQKFYATLRIWQDDGRLYMPMLSQILKQFEDRDFDGKGVTFPLGVVDPTQMSYLYMPLLWAEYLNRNTGGIT